tara:strand:- start:863 stop:1117 length:255 start_codon:yes stop_codon:yes gene_type:complete
MEKILPNELKAARTLLGMSQRELSEKAGVSLVTLRRLESQLDYASMVSAATTTKVRDALEASGIIFLEPGDVVRGRGVALGDPT